MAKLTEATSGMPALGETPGSDPVSRRNGRAEPPFGPRPQTAISVERGGQSVLTAD